MILHKDITEDQRQPKDRWYYSEQISGILESITDGFFVIDQHFRCNYGTMRQRGSPVSLL
jgi:hypothetical protein